MSARFGIGAVTATAALALFGATWAARGGYARLRLLQGQGAADLSGKAAGSRALRDVSRRIQYHSAPRKITRRPIDLDRRADPQKLRYCLKDRAGGRRSDDCQDSDASAGAGSRRRCVSFRRTAIRQQERSGLEDHRGLGAGREADAGEEAENPISSWPGLSRPSTSLFLPAIKKVVDARHIGERSDAVLWTANTNAQID